MSILNNYEWTCEECQGRVESMSLWRKRLDVDMGVRNFIDGKNERSGLKPGFTFFSKNDGMRNPESSNKANKYCNYGAKFEIENMSNKKSLFDIKNSTENSAHKSLHIMNNNYRVVTPPKKTSYSQQEQNSINWSAEK